jgi:predicted transport protein
MKNSNLFRPEKVNLLNNPEINEATIQGIIAEDPSILGLGDLVLKDKERVQPRAGRLDLLFQDSDTQRRYEVEIQLGKTDESHIIRTIEYWDTERKRYPQYDHCAVIVAEDITTRFNNVINLFNGSIPIVAIQMNAYKFGEKIGLVFTTVMNELTLGLVDEDEEIQEITDRNYWLNRGTEQTVKLADKLLAIINEFSVGYELKYNKFYIGLAKDGQPNNFASFRPQKVALAIEIRLPYSDEVQKKIIDGGLDDMGYLKRWGRYRLRLTSEDLEVRKAIIKDLLLQAYEYSK